MILLAIFVFPRIFSSNDEHFIRLEAELILACHISENARNYFLQQRTDAELQRLSKDFDEEGSEVKGKELCQQEFEQPLRKHKRWKLAPLNKAPHPFPPEVIKNIKTFLFVQKL